MAKVGSKVSLRGRRPGARSSIEQLPKEILDVVNQLIRDGYTIREIVDKVSELGATVSKSSVGRYAKHAHEMLQDYSEAQELSTIWLDRLEKEPNGDVGRLLQEMLKTVAVSTMASIKEDGKTAKPGELMALSIAIKNMSSAEKEAFNIAILRKKVQEQAKQAADKVTQQAKKAGLSAEHINQFRAEILGISG